jgi:uncharacterized lipoprotein YddW (UPF0748 family)
MKKIIMSLIISLGIIVSFNIDEVQSASEKTIFKYGTNTPIKYQDGKNTNITVPSEYISPKQELRGAWVATVSNLNIPKQSGTTTSAINAYKNEYIKILDTLESYSMNAIFFQVRPMNDAFYESELNPWSRYLIGTEGKNPGWDPLEWMVAETHKRGMEFHAWLNPYRVSGSAASNKQTYLNTLATNNFARKNPDLVIQDGDNKLILNPGEPAVQQFIVDTIMEITENYDVDAIHFDDYFYPYSGVGNNDATTFANHNSNNLSLGDWRRENVDTVIYNIKQELTAYNQSHNKAVQFGISPFGIWANKSSNPLGSDTNGSQSYYTQYADTRKWVKEGWIDYILPQIYWEFEKTVAPYADLVKWWSDVVKDTNVNLYIGHAIYRAGSSGGWMNMDELENQLKYNQKYPEVDGSVMYSYSYLIRKDTPQLINSQNMLKGYYNDNKVILPVHGNIAASGALEVTNLKSTVLDSQNKLTWNTSQNARSYAVYRFNSNETIDLNSGKHLLDVVYPTGTTVEYIDQTVESGVTYRYVITALNKVNQESAGTTVLASPILGNPKIENTKDLTFEVGTENPDFIQHVKAYDGYNQDVTNQMVIDSSQVKLNVIGTYPLIYSITDEMNQTVNVEINVKIVDKTKPVLEGFKNLTININTIPNYLDGVTAFDNYDGNLTEQIEVDDRLVDLAQFGTYDLYYIITDSNGNQTKQKVRVFIEDYLSPTFTGVKDIIIDLNETPNYLDGISASDNYDGDLTEQIQIDNHLVKLDEVGVYPVVYKVTDSNGNVNTVTIKVYVGEEEIEDNTPPIDEVEDNKKDASFKLEYMVIGASVLVIGAAVAIIRSKRY